MRKIAILTVLAVVVVLGSCQKGPETNGPWFDGGFDDALAEAGARGSLVLMDFYSDT